MADPWQLQVGAINVAELGRSQLAMIRLGRCSSDAKPALERLFGLELPPEPNTARGQQPRAIWTGPNEGLAVGVALQVGPENTPRAPPMLAVDVSDGRYGLDVSGAQARDLLAKGCSLDLHPSLFGVDRTARTLFAQVPVLIDHVEDGLFRLWFDVSYRTYLRSWFADALIEFS